MPAPLLVGVFAVHVWVHDLDPWLLLLYPRPLLYLALCGAVHLGLHHLSVLLNAGLGRHSWRFAGFDLRVDLLLHLPDEGRQPLVQGQDHPEGKSVQGIDRVGQLPLLPVHVLLHVRVLLLHRWPLPVLASSDSVHPRISPAGRRYYRRYYLWFVWSCRRVPYLQRFLIFSFFFFFFNYLLDNLDIFRFYSAISVSVVINFFFF